MKNFSLGVICTGLLFVFSLALIRPNYLITPMPGDIPINRIQDKYVIVIGHMPEIHPSNWRKSSGHPGAVWVFKTKEQADEAIRKIEGD